MNNRLPRFNEEEEPDQQKKKIKQLYVRALSSIVLALIAQFAPKAGQCHMIAGKAFQWFQRYC